jgi:hypothetical protein
LPSAISARRVRRQQDLSDCFKIYIDERRHRIVYRLLLNAKRPETVDVIVIGERELRDVSRSPSTAAERSGADVSASSAFFGRQERKAEAELMAGVFGV